MFVTLNYWDYLGDQGLQILSLRAVCCSALVYSVNLDLDVDFFWGEGTFGSPVFEKNCPSVGSKSVG
jgi:hypothetical protein